MSSNIHLLVGMKPHMAVSDLAREIKANSSRYINEQNWINGKFHWQEGYGAFSYSRSQLDVVCRYIQNQENHHKKRTFREEYLELLEKYDIEYDSNYLFEFYG